MKRERNKNNDRHEENARWMDAPHEPCDLAHRHAVVAPRVEPAHALVARARVAGAGALAAAANGLVVPRAGVLARPAGRDVPANFFFFLGVGVVG
jgi:hypothetical protein